MFHTGDPRLRAIERCNMQLRRRAFAAAGRRLLRALERVRGARGHGRS